MSAICARLSQKEVGVKRVETLVSTLLPRRGARHVPAVRRRRIFSLNLSEKPPARKETNTLTQFEYPAQPVQKRSRPLGANTLTQFASPVSRCRKNRLRGSHSLDCPIHENEKGTAHAVPLPSVDMSAAQQQQLPQLPQPPQVLSPQVPQEPQPPLP